MAIVASQPEEGSKFPPMEPGTYIAVCYAVIDIGEQYSEKFDKSARKVILMWEIPDETIDIDGKPMPRAISGTYTLSLGEKASLRKMLEGWRGRVFTELELKGFDLGNVLGAPCMLGIIQEPREDKVYARISTVSKIPKGIPAPTGTINKQIYFDLTDPGALDAVEALPEWVKEKVKKSTTYLELKVPKGQSLGANED